MHLYIYNFTYTLQILMLDLFISGTTQVWSITLSILKRYLNSLTKNWSIYKKSWCFPCRHSNQLTPWLSAVLSSPIARFPLQLECVTFLNKDHLSIMQIQFYHWSRDTFRTHKEQNNRSIRSGICLSFLVWFCVKMKYPNEVKWREESAFWLAIHWLFVRGGKSN